MSEVKLLEIYQMLSEVSTLWCNNGGDKETQAVIDEACGKIHDKLERAKTLSDIVSANNNARFSNATERY